MCGNIVCSSGCNTAATVIIELLIYIKVWTNEVFPYCYDKNDVTESCDIAVDQW